MNSFKNESPSNSILRRRIPLNPLFVISETTSSLDEIYFEYDRSEMTEKISRVVYGMFQLHDDKSLMSHSELCNLPRDLVHTMLNSFSVIFLKESDHQSSSLKDEIRQVSPNTIICCDGNAFDIVTMVLGCPVPPQNSEEAICDFQGVT